MSITAKCRQEYEAFQQKEGYYVDREATAIELTGADRNSFLHNFCTADVKGLAAGSSTEAFVLNPKGKTLFFLQILAEAERLILLIPKAQESDLKAHLSRYIIVEDVTLNVLDDSVVYASFEFEGAFPTDLGDQGFVGVIPEDSSAWEGTGKTALSKDAFEIIRVENGFPLSGIDVTDDCLAQEFERDATAISFDKGCYLGQETVARLDALGHTNRAFRWGRCESESIPDLQTELKIEGKACGRVTSVVWSPAAGCHLALLMVKKPHHGSGTQMLWGDLQITVADSLS